MNRKPFHEHMRQRPLTSFRRDEYVARLRNVLSADAKRASARADVLAAGVVPILDHLHGDAARCQQSARREAGAAAASTVREDRREFHERRSQAARDNAGMLAEGARELHARVSRECWDHPDPTNERELRSAIRGAAVSVVAKARLLLERGDLWQTPPAAGQAETVAATLPETSAAGPAIDARLAAVTAGDRASLFSLGATVLVECETVQARVLRAVRPREALPQTLVFVPTALA